MDSKTTSIRKSLAALLSLPMAALAQGNLSVSDTLNNYQLYGKTWIRIDGDAETSQGGGVGSDNFVNLSNANVKINGDLTSGGAITTTRRVTVAGKVNARGKVILVDDANIVSGSLNVGDSLVVSGGNPMGNVFGGPINVWYEPVKVKAWATNKWIGVDIMGDLSNFTKPAGVIFGANSPFPTTSMRLPDTTVNFNALRNCTTVPSVTFNMSMCFTGSPTDTILPPGRYGDFRLASGNTLYMTSGTYHFKSFEMLSDGSKVLFIQSSGSTTRVLIQDFFTVRAGIQLIAPTKYTDPTFKNGTVFIFCNGPINLDDDNNVWATVVGKNNVTVQSGLRLFGQLFGGTVYIENGFKGGTGLGKYLPMAVGKGPLRYSIMHFKHQF